MPAGLLPPGPMRRAPGWRGMRDRLVASPAFRRRVARFPVGGWIARRQSRRLFDLCAGFVYSQVLAACVQLDLPAMLLEGPQPVDRLAARLGLAPGRAAMLLEAAAALGIAERRRNGAFGAGMLGATLAGDAAVRAMVAHHAMLYRDLADPVALLRRSPDTALAGFWPYAGSTAPAALGAEDVAGYTGLMAASQPLVAHEIVGAYRLARHRCLLDVAGGDGSFIAAAAEAAPALTFMLFDLPAVAAQATLRFARSGLAGRARAVGGDARDGALPHGADIATLIRVLHDHSDADALAILGSIRRALPPGGTLLVAEPMAGTHGAEPVGAYFAFYLLGMGSGRPRHVDELRGLIETAGFRHVREHPTAQPLLARVLTAKV